MPKSKETTPHGSTAGSLASRVPLYRCARCQIIIGRGYLMQDIALVHRDRLAIPARQWSKYALADAYAGVCLLCIHELQPADESILWLIQHEELSSASAWTRQRLQQRTRLLVKEPPHEHRTVSRS